MPAGSSRFDAVNQLNLLWDRLNCGSAVSGTLLRRDAGEDHLAAHRAKDDSEWQFRFQDIAPKIDQGETRKVPC